jgi:hypothetical protein
LAALCVAVLALRRRDLYRVADEQNSERGQYQPVKRVQIGQCRTVPSGRDLADDADEGIGSLVGRPPFPVMRLVTT